MRASWIVIQWGGGWNPVERVRHSHVKAKWAGASKTSGEEREPEEWWSRVCVSESFRVSNWKYEIQLNSELPALSGEMWES